MNHSLTVLQENQYVCVCVCVRVRVLGNIDMFIRFCAKAGKQGESKVVGSGMALSVRNKPKLMTNIQCKTEKWIGKYTHNVSCQRKLWWKAVGSVSALLLTQPASPAEQSWGSAYRTDLQEIPEAVVGLYKMFGRDALLSEHVQDSAVPCLLYGCSPRRRHATIPV